MKVFITPAFSYFLTVAATHGQNPANKYFINGVEFGYENTFINPDNILETSIKLNGEIKEYHLKTYVITFVDYEELKFKVKTRKDLKNPAVMVDKELCTNKNQLRIDESLIKKIEYEPGPGREGTIVIRTKFYKKKAKKNALKMN